MGVTPPLIWAACWITDDGNDPDQPLGLFAKGPSLARKCGRTGSSAGHIALAAVMGRGFSGTEDGIGRNRWAGQDQIGGFRGTKSPICPAALFDAESDVVGSWDLPYVFCR